MIPAYDAKVDHLIDQFAPNCRKVIGAKISQVMEKNLDDVQVHYLVISAAAVPVALIYITEFRLKFASRNFRMAICGQPFFGVNCGINFTRKSENGILPGILKTIEEAFNKSKFSAIFFKDMDGPKEIYSQEGFYPIPIDPVMAIESVDRWTCFDNYLADLNPKYKRKILSAELKVKNWGYTIDSEIEILAHIERLFELYSIVASHNPKLQNESINPDNLSAFLVNLPRLLGIREVNKQFLLDLMKEYAENIDILVIENSNNIVAFTFNILLDKTYHSLFLGMEYIGKQVPFIYRTLLSSVIKKAIERGADRIIFGRTGLLTKAEIGAKQMPWLCYGKIIDPDFTSLNPVLNNYFSRAHFMQPPVRNVFKKTNILNHFANKDLINYEK